MELAILSTTLAGFGDAAIADNSEFVLAYTKQIYKMCLCVSSAL
ncbi:hypothetical protein [Nostoc sp. T09]|nr:hypothetical protein [Nostoc sp. T09]